MRKKQKQALRFKQWRRDGHNMEIMARHAVQLDNGRWQDHGPLLRLLIPIEALISDTALEAQQVAREVRAIEIVDVWNGNVPLWE